MNANRIGTKTIETKRCILRRIRPDDYRMMYDHWAKYESVCRYFPFDSIEDIEVYQQKVLGWSDHYAPDVYFY